MSDSQLTTTERISGRIDKTITGSLAVGAGGNLDFANLNEIMEVARVVAISQAAIPKHLRDNVGACLAVCIQASEWRLSPFAVANKTYVVNDRIAFEAQLIAAVILKRAPITGRIAYTFSGEGNTRKCKASATLKEDGSVVDYETPEFIKIPVKNSPLWKSDPDQQLGYMAVRALCRRHFPDVILGIYTPDELEEAPEIKTIKVATVGQVQSQPDRPATVMELAAAEKAKAVEPKPEPEPEEKEPEAKPTPAPKAEEKPVKLQKQLAEKCAAAGIAKGLLMEYLSKNGFAAEEAKIEDMTAKQIEATVDVWDDVVAGVKAM